MRAPVGLRIRNYRKSKGLSQSALARLVEISASYLNLIEANKRDVGGLLLQKIAARLQVDLHDLTGESEQRLINELQEAFADPLLAPLKLGIDDAHRLVALFPEGARALHACFRGYLEAVASLERASNRLQSDPIFSQLLHQMLSQITAVRSVAEILKSVPDVPESKRTAFYNSVYSESLALSDSARTLIAQFDEEVDQRRTITPARELNDLIIGENNFFPALEDAADTLGTGLGLPETLSEEQLGDILQSRHGISVETSAAAGPLHFGSGIAGYDAANSTMTFKPHIASATKRFQLARLLAILEAGPVLGRLCQDPRLTSGDARELAHSAMASYLAGALIFPYERFLSDAGQCHYDLEALARTYRASFEQIAHRLVTLRKPSAKGIPFGFLRTDAAGYLTKQFPLPGLLMPNAGHACPLWAIYAAFRGPGALARQIASFADGSRYLFIAKVGTKRVTAFNELPVFSSVMLACDLIHADKTIYGRDIRLDAPGLDVPVGPSCRLCIRSGCGHRQEAATTPKTLAS